MSEVRVFLSFEFDKDEKPHRNFYAQAKRGDSRHVICDYSLNETYRPDENWVQKARKKISQCDIVIVMTREDTHNAPGVKKEEAIANQLKKPIFQVKPREGNYGKVHGAGELIPWEWKKIDGMIDKLLKLSTRRD